jgi:hypothetical protein
MNTFPDSSGSWQEQVHELYPNALVAYTYHDRQGRPRYLHVRLDTEEHGKKFRWATIFDDGSVEAGRRPLQVQVEPLYRYAEAKRRLDDLGPAEVWVCEGEKDCDTLWDSGRVSVCQPDGASKYGHAVKWRELYTTAIRQLHPTAINVVADNDPPGVWTAGQIADLLDAARWVPVEGNDVTDSRGQVRKVDQFEGYNGRPKRGDGGNGAKGKEKDAPIVQQLVRLARDKYTLVVADTGMAYAIDGDSHIVIPATAAKLGARLRVIAEKRLDSVLSSTSITAAVDQLAATAADGPTRPIYLRVARLDDRVVVDLGTGSDQVVVINSEGWSVTTSSPVLFRRSNTTKLMPVPARPGLLDDLRPIINVNDEQWPLILGWLVAALLDVPLPILAITGEQGSAKTSMVRFVRRLLDESPALTRALPRDIEQWSITASASRVVALDNVSHMQPWLQDALCRAATGEGFEKRALYTNDDVHVLAFRRPVILNGIGLGAIQGDLGDRLLPIELHPISDAQRQDEEDLEARFARIRPGFLGGLYDLTAHVLKQLPGVKLDRKPRMADFAKVLAAVEQVTGLQALGRYLGAREGVVDMVLAGDQVGSALLAWFNGRGVDSCEMTVAEIRTELGHFLDRNNVRPDKTWPQNPRAMGDRLRRAATALRTRGVEIESLGNVGGRGYRYRIRRV